MRRYPTHRQWSRQQQEPAHQSQVEQAACARQTVTASEGYERQESQVEYEYDSTSRAETLS